MSSTLTIVVPAALSATFDMAVYRFLELWGDDNPDAVPMLTTTPDGSLARKELQLWSETAKHEFELYWRSFQKKPTFRLRGGGMVALNG